MCLSLCLLDSSRLCGSNAIGCCIANAAGMSWDLFEAVLCGSHGESKNGENALSCMNGDISRFQITPVTWFVSSSRFLLITTLLRCIADLVLDPFPLTPRRNRSPFKTRFSLDSRPPAHLIPNSATHFHALSHDKYAAPIRIPLSSTVHAQFALRGRATVQPETTAMKTGLQ